MANKKNILVCPLNWGLGHATRVMPIIYLLIKQKHNVVIAANGYPLELLKKEFPNLKFICFHSFNIKYSKNNSLIFKILLSLPRILFGIRKEHQQLKKIIKNEKIDVVISDNRYGLWNKNVYSVFITHQIMVKTPKYLKLFEYPAYLISKFFILKYDKCWVPDYADENNLSGDLSHKYKLPENVSFIGHLSRFDNMPKQENHIEKNIDLLVILSGPEPQRTILENIIIKQTINTNYKVLIIEGKPQKTNNTKHLQNINITTHLQTEELLKKIRSSNVVMSRAGYSTIMDFVSLNKNAILVPTPGQTEQQYLSKYLNHKKLFYFVKQENLNIENTMIDFQNFHSQKLSLNNNLLEKEIEKLFNVRST